MTIPRSTRAERLRLGLLVPVLGCALLLGCRSEDPREELQSFLDEDPGHATLAELVEERDQDMAQFAQHRVGLVERFRGLNADYDANPEELQAVVTEFEEALMAHREGLLDAAMEMREATDPEDWAAFAELDLAVLLEAAGANPLFPSKQPQE